MTELKNNFIESVYKYVDNLDYLNFLFEKLNEYCYVYCNINNLIKNYDTIIQDILNNFLYNLDNIPEFIDVLKINYGVFQLENNLSIDDFFDRNKINKWKSFIKKNEYYESNRTYMPECKNFFCFVCKGNSGVSYMQQTRSADEPPTVFTVCLTCKKVTKK